MIKADQNQTELQGMVMLMLFIFKVAIAFEILGALVLTLHLAGLPDPLAEALGLGVFMVSRDLPMRVLICLETACGASGRTIWSRACSVFCS